MGGAFGVTHRLATALIVFALPACSDQGGSGSHSAVSLGLPVATVAAQSASDDLHGLIGALLDCRNPSMPVASSTERVELCQLYGPDGWPLWVDPGGRPTRNMADALQVLRHAADDGLDPTAYLEDQVTVAATRRETAWAPHDAARLDVAISAGMLRYLRDVHIGRVDPRTLGFRLDEPADRHDFAALLRVAISEWRVPELAADLRPPLAQYRLLRSMLPRYRSLAADPTLGAPPFANRAIHPGEPYPDLAVLQNQLRALGDLSPESTSVVAAERYQGPVVAAVQRFQTRHGLDPDAVVGMRTLAALRVPLSWRVRQIELALERLRWLPHLGEARLLALNIPMFRLWTWDAIAPSGAPLLGMDAIVGRALGTPTPVLRAWMGEVVFRPYWNVPRSILRHELQPRLERDPDYLRREDMEIVRGDGDNAAHVEMSAAAVAGLRAGVLRVRQRPGPKNALGLLKFVFPNREDVYLHGTPAQALFARTRRDFSHGCVRVADPVMLAEWVLKDRPEWTRDRIVATTMGTQTIHVRLPRPIQVILFYTTAAVMPEDGTIRFAEDIYRHDEGLDRVLAKRDQLP